MDISFSVHLRDYDGDVYDKCILLHFNDNLILRLNNLDEYNFLIDKLQHMYEEITETWTNQT